VAAPEEVTTPEEDAPEVEDTSGPEDDNICNQQVRGSRISLTLALPRTRQQVRLESRLLPVLAAANGYYVLDLGLHERPNLTYQPGELFRRFYRNAEQLPLRWSS
jgi:hypothetical protein